jgi:hypothetical protein
MCGVTERRITRNPIAIHPRDYFETREREREEFRDDTEDVTARGPRWLFFFLLYIYFWISTCPIAES